MLNKAIELLSLSKSLIVERLEGEPHGIIKADEERFTTEKVFEAEEYIANKIIQLQMNTKPILSKDQLEEFIDDYCKKNNVELEENQRQFFHDWNENNVLMLVGGGGMGKSWLQNILLEMIAKKRQGYRHALLAPTGKASKVMSGYTGKEAMTIHRKVGVHDEDDDEGRKLLFEDVIIIDESSMCDVFILSKFFKAVKNPNVRILFVGDDFQLPSVGVGNFLYDILHSNIVKVSQLKKVFRQSEGGILDIATRIRNGQKFLNDSDEGRHVFGKDFVAWLVHSQHIEQGVSTNYAKLMKKFTQDEVIVLTPTSKGKLGTISLNKMIQSIVNPESATKKQVAVGKKDAPTYFRVGDRIMNVVNTYDVETVDGGTADVFNGDTGKIIDILEEEKLATIDFEGVIVNMTFGNMYKNLLHAWAMTIHKSQGSQYKVVIMIADKSATYQLNANLLYTGISRATEYVLLLGQAETINRSIKKFANMERRSFLQELLHSANGNGQILKPQGIEKEKIISHEEVIESNVDFEKEPDITLLSLTERTNMLTIVETEEEDDDDYYM